MSEIQLQADCFQWHWNNYPDLRRLLWAVPNGGARSKVEAAQLKASGVVAGVFDLHFFYCEQLYIFELKVGNNVKSKAQEDWEKIMVAEGAIAFEIRTLEEFQNKIISIVGY